MMVNKNLELELAALVLDNHSLDTAGSDNFVDLDIQVDILYGIVPLDIHFGNLVVDYRHVSSGSMNVHEMVINFYDFGICQRWSCGFSLNFDSFPCWTCNPVKEIYSGDSLVGNHPD